MSEKIRKGFSKSIDWNVTTDKKRTETLSESTKTIARELDKNPIPNSNELNSDKKK
ncbi:hypothetical protein [Legionella longbeachae]|uniref:Uncharacterized protein n=1 Tax=Legionella longbeachae serogroup 1 (strain NSW150) TaxID=661367 RepID=D3HSZ4_LEGLN|nr:hypothetical protein [Legionella longbeachae]VEE02525.1 Uncharacterised protein [Legionella oakridgensis]HBD7398785.1 hypothetical protein [Legionella pneumophila]EEZ94835.1 hypothetical protein LLB_3753 [Legionella longbeachae D-4968]UAK45603.1 hypothetical protein K8O86_12455 [Legionella longbeachae]CBJ12034.1 hypothetical protein LLO_1659 [Legionella longbeachae NSW150]